MKVALVGSSGYIAGFLIKRFQSEQGIGSILKVDQNSDADMYLNLFCADKFDYSILDDIDYVIFTAAISSPDKCAEDFENCWKVNVEGTKYYIHQAIEHGCRVLFFSSDAVFGDIAGYIYTEESETRADTPYGRMKKAVEDEFKDNCNFKALRLSYVVSAKDRFVSYCLDCMKNGETADIFHPFYRNCISVSDVVDVVIWMVQNWERYESFVLNVAGKELVSRIRILDEINRYYEKNIDYIVSTPDDNFFANRPKVTQMRSMYMQTYNILEDNTFTEKIQKELKEISL